MKSNVCHPYVYKAEANFWNNKWVLGIKFMNATTTQHGMLLRNNHSVRQGTAQIATDFGLHRETKIQIWSVVAVHDYLFQMLRLFRADPSWCCRHDAAASCVITVNVNVHLHMQVQIEAGQSLS